MQLETLIIKYAYGGTYLTDNTTNEAFSKRWGNWCPPSMPRSNETIIAENAEAGTFGQKLSGRLYDNCIATVTEAIKAYEKEGYVPSLKGTFWMQGEADCDGSYASKDYKAHLTALIKDIRSDFVEIFQDDTAAYAPFVIGKIASTFNGGGSNIEAVRTIQEQVANSLESVYCVETKDYIIVNSDGTLAEGCDDRYHFNGNDMLSIGKAVGEQILAGSKPRLQVITTSGGSANIKSALLTGNPIAITFTPNKNWSLSKVYKNNVDVTSNVVNNTFTITETDGFYIIKAEFVEYSKYRLNTIYDEEKGSVIANRMGGTNYVGTEITLTVEPKEGCIVKSVTFNNQPLHPNANGKYVIAIVEGENDFVVVFESLTINDKPDNNNPNNNTGNETENDKPSVDNTPSKEQTAKEGCFSSTSIIAIFPLLLSACALKIKRNKRQ